MQIISRLFKSEPGGLLRRSFRKSSRGVLPITSSSIRSASSMSVKFSPCHELINVLVWGPFKCYVTPGGVGGGGCDPALRSVTGGWGGGGGGGLLVLVLRNACIYFIR